MQGFALAIGPNSWDVSSSQDLAMRFWFKSAFSRNDLVPSIPTTLALGNSKHLKTGNSSQGAMASLWG